MSPPISGVIDTDQEHQTALASASLSDKNTWAIGDIHGCLTELKAIVKLIPERDRLVFLGDYIDRGADSKGVIEYLIHLQNERGRDNIQCLAGNHEMLMIEAYNADDPFERNKLYTRWIINGGWETIVSYDLELDGNANREAPINMRVIKEDHIEWMQKTLQILSVEANMICVHAGFDLLHKMHGNVPVDEYLQHISWDQDQIKKMVWIRDQWIAAEEMWAYEKPVIYGHTMMRHIHRQGLYGKYHKVIDNDPNYPHIGRKSVGIDTGCWTADGVLTAANVLADRQSIEFIQVAKDGSMRRLMDDFPTGERDGEQHNN